jgi:Putative peptidoglycan binding domain/L,D-transpeptidase catalytic domain
MRPRMRRGLGVAAASTVLVTAGLAAGGLAAGQASAATAGPAAYKPPSHDLFYGNKGAAVRSVQRRLSQLHYYPGPIDGKYGADLEQAVWAFKEVQGLPMNRWSNSVITYAFRKALVHPKAPRVLIRHGQAKRIEINLHVQVLVLYRNHKPALILHVSSGGNCLVDQGCGWITPDGNYSALSFDPGWVHVPLGEMFNPVFFIGTAYAIHGDVPVPWYPDSHGCVRIWMDAAAWFHRDVTVNPDGHGTPVYIRGTAPYSPLAG